MRRLIALLATTMLLSLSTHAQSPQFAFELYKQLATGDANLCYSPYSVAVALGMTAEGAGGVTREEMLSVLHAPADDTARLQAVEAAAESLAKATSNQLRLEIANRVWIKQGYAVRPDYTALLHQRFDASSAAFGEVGGLPAEVNGWVAKQTHGKITRLLEPAMLSPLTRLVLVNAVYFNGSWGTRFDKSETYDAPFRLPDGSALRVPTMHQQRKHLYAEADGCQVLELPYAGDRLAMTILLPAKADGLPALVAKLDAARFAAITGTLEERLVAVMLPRFKLDSTVPLSGPLQKLGMKQAFSDTTADFSGITPDPQGLFIAAVAHRATVDVSESGTEAAAATGVVMAARSMPTGLAVFRADHPFLFVIRDRLSGAILFMGQVVKPGA